MFRRKYNPADRKLITSPTGSPIYVKYGWTYVDGEYKYVAKDKTNVYEMIQAARDSVDLSAMLQRFEAGDKTALEKVQGMYFDTVDMPKNYAELYRAVSNCNTIFDSMPAEIKQQFNNNPAEFWKKSGSPEFDSVINSYRSSVLNKRGLVDDNPVQTVSTEVVKDVEKSE